jgi:hypothetical protein
MKKKSEQSTSSLLKILNSSDDIYSFLESFDNELKPENFLDVLNKLIIDKKCNISEILNKGYLNESYGYQIFNGTRKPSRDKIIQVSFGMGLDLYETNRLLRSGGKAELYCRDKRDAVIIFGLNEKLSIIEVEEILMYNGFASIVGMKE